MNNIQYKLGIEKAYFEVRGSVILAAAINEIFCGIWQDEIIIGQVNMPETIAEFGYLPPDEMFIEIVKKYL